MCGMGLLDVLTEAIPNMMPGCGDTVDCNGRSVAVRKVWRASKSFMIIWRTCIEDIFANVEVLFACVLVVFWFTVLVKCSLRCRSSHISRHCLFMLEYCKEGEIGECLTVFKPHIISQVPCGSAKGGG